MGTMPTTAQPVDKCSREPTFREVLEREIMLTAARHNALKRLADSMPLELPYAADKLMREMIARL